MKLIKAFVRTNRLAGVVQALEDAGAPGITVSRVHGVGYGYDPSLFTLAPCDIRQAPEIAKIEVVCAEGDVDRLIAVLVQAARTGIKGDGIVFVTPVERAVRIRTGAEGFEALTGHGAGP